MKKLLIIALACYGLNAAAQKRESKNFLYLYSDSVIYARDIKFRPDFSGYLQLRVDSRNYPTAQVKFFNSREGFFANTRKMGILRRSEFAERIIEGRINVFQERSISSAAFVHDPYHSYDAHYMHTSAPSINVNMYYNKGYEDMKKLNFHNLKHDMSDNPQSMDMLYAYRRSMNTTKMLYTAAGVSILAGLITFITDGKDINSTTRSFAIGGGLALAGVGMAAGGYLNSISANNKLEDAVEIYNK